MTAENLFDIDEPEPLPTIALPAYDAYVLVRQQREYYGEPDRYGNVKHRLVPVIAWESAGTLEYCRGVILDEELWDEGVICRVHGTLEVVEVVSAQKHSFDLFDQ